MDETVELINKYDSVYATIGFHPDQVDIVKDEDIVKLKQIILSNKKIVGIGEIGLDYHYDKSKKEQQQQLFEKQLQVAQELKIPVVIHTRDATMDTINILKKYDLRGVIHCFSGSYEVAMTYINMGYKLGIGGVVTFKNSKLHEVVEKISISNILLETDSPYLTPEPFRGKTNSSKYIPIIAKKIAEIKKVSEEKLAKLILNNTYEMFDLNK